MQHSRGLARFGVVKRLDASVVRQSLAKDVKVWNLEVVLVMLGHDDSCLAPRSKIRQPITSQELNRLQD